MFFTDFYTPFYCFSYISCHHLYFFVDFLIFFANLYAFFADFNSLFSNLLTVFFAFFAFCQCFCLFYGDPGRIAHLSGVSSLRSDRLRRPLRDRTSSYPCRLSHKKNLRFSRRFFLMAIPAGFELATHSLEGCCSIRLSYGTVFLNLYPFLPALSTLLFVSPQIFAFPHAISTPFRKISSAVCVRSPVCVCIISGL